LNVDYRDTLRRLIEIDTSGPDADGCRRALGVLEEELASVGLSTSLVEIPASAADGLDGRAALIARRDKRGARRLIVYGHIDVVPASGWDAFHAVFRDGRIYGRGAADMKGSLCALVGALASLQHADPAYDLSAVVTMDEETQQLDQLEYLSRSLRSDDQALVLSLDGGFGYVSIANLGVLQLDIRVEGESVHSGLAHLGRNAVEGAAQLIDALLELRPEVVARRSHVPSNPETEVSFLEPRLNINRIEGGLARNVVPDTCTFSIDRRLTPEESLDGARGEILRALGGVGGVQWSVAREFVIPPVPPCTHEAAEELARIVRDVTGSTGLYGEMMSGELPYAATRWWNGAVFGLGLIRPDSHVHGVDEYVNERDLEHLMEVLTRFLTTDREEAA
jgi:succinyl-diaminopimelate desuccinylase